MDDVCDTHDGSTIPGAIFLTAHCQLTVILTSTTVLLSSSVEVAGGQLLVCLKDSQFPGIFKNLTTRTLSRSWCVGMMTVQFSAICHWLK